MFGCSLCGLVDFAGFVVADCFGWCVYFGAFVGFVCVCLLCDAFGFWLWCLNLFLFGCFMLLLAFYLCCLVWFGSLVGLYDFGYLFSYLLLSYAGYCL